MEKFIDKIKTSVKSVARSAKKKTKQLTQTTELKIDIKLEESTLEEYFEKLGRVVFLKYKAEQNENASVEKYDEKIATLVNRANEISEKIMEYKNQLAEIKGKEVCPRCQAVIDADAPCEYCNEKIVANEKTEDEATEQEQKEVEEAVNPEEKPQE